MIKTLISLCLLILLSGNLHAQDSVLLRSPDNKIALLLNLTGKLGYSVYYDSRSLMAVSTLDMILEGGSSLGADLRIKKKSTISVNDTILSPVPEKRVKIADRYNQLTIEFRQPFTLELRAYDDGIAYRILTRFRDSIIVKDEPAGFRFAHGRKALLPLIDVQKGVDPFHTSFESQFQWRQIDSLDGSTMAYSPVLTGSDDEIKVALTESDLEDYPGMFLFGSSDGSLNAVYAGYPLEEIMTTGEFPQAHVTRRADYIAHTKGTRSFPWRVMMIAANDRDLPGNDLVYRLGSPSRLKETSWIHPGKGTDEWIIGINLFNVSFKTGVNTDTYKYYIDFAKRFGFDRIMMDAGWSNYKDLFDINPAINMDTIAAYARKKGIHLSMWTLCTTLDRQLDSALNQFNRWGVDFIMTDFMDRDDQQTVNFYYRIARACADHQLMIMFHGAFAPKGFNRTFPNSITREGVLGSEYNIWSDKPDPEHDLNLPFTRMLAGSFDYEPGILDNATKAQFRPIGQKVMSQGTRCHQLSMFVVFDSPLQIFSGNPSQGYLEPAFMEFLGSVPTTWDETVIVDAKVSDYIITARKKGNDWWLGGMTDWSKRNFELKLDFLDEGSYDAQLCRDGINAGSYPSDYSIQSFIVAKSKPFHIEMAEGGGFVLKLKKRPN